MHLKPWQRAWLILVVVGSVLHGVRDFLQMSGSTIWFVTFLHRDGPESSLLWHELNTVVIELTLLIASSYLLYKNQFGRIGWLTVWAAVATGIGFLVFWYFV